MADVYDGGPMGTVVDQKPIPTQEPQSDYQQVLQFDYKVVSIDEVVDGENPLELGIGCSNSGRRTEIWNYQATTSGFNGKAVGYLSLPELLE